MSAAPVREQVQTVDRRSAPRVVELLETPRAGQTRLDAILFHQHLLDALDRADHRHMVVWPERDPAAVAHLSSSGTLIVAGGASGGQPLAAHLANAGWRVLLGDAALADRILETGSRGLMRRRVRAREQRFMATTRPADLDWPEGLRLARASDLDVVTEMAARLHVEDQMGPPLSRAARSGVADRMRGSIARGLTWVIEREGTSVAKIDVSMMTAKRGAQIAGVYVDEAWRGTGLAGGGVAGVARALMADGAPGVTLHVRSDNLAGQRAYRRAGFVDQGAWMLALR